MTSAKRMYKNNLLTIGSIFGIFVLFIGMSIIPSTGDIIEEKKVNILTITEISGLYYLRDDDPLNYADEGSLLRTVPLENEVTLCGAFILFRFDEQAVYQGNYSIFNIYYHIWQKTPESPFEGEIFDLGYYTSSGHNTYMNESIMINTSEYVAVVDNYRLVQAMQFVNPDIAFFRGDGIYDLTIKSTGNGPSIRTFPNQYSFVILNLEDNATLQNYDRDGDYVNDFDELFVYYTNPFDSDTDGDGFSDYEEGMAGTDPNNNAEYPESNTPPNKPIGSGATSGKIGISYDYTFVVTDADGDSIFLWIGWGDNSTEEWIGAYPSGQEVIISHIWDARGTYTIKAKARDIFEDESDWAYLDVTMPVSPQSANPWFYRFLERFPNAFPILRHLSGLLL